MRHHPIAMALLAALVAAAPQTLAAAGGVDVTFAPPEISERAICAPRLPQAQLEARWRGWHGGSPLPDMSTELIRRDMGVLRVSDAAHWFDTIAAVQQALLQQRDDYEDSEALSDRVELLLAAGRDAQLRDEGLIETLLARAEAGDTALQFDAANLLLDGLAVKADPDRALHFLIAAGYAGGSDALLRLAAMTADGTRLEGWDIAPEIAVTLAFGALMGGLDPIICDKMNRIGSQYRLGGIVRQNLGLAERWYRLSAQLGDYNAAWQVARMHLYAEGIDKDNDVLIAHLRQAAEGGLPYAQVEWGRALARGALVAQDLPEAERQFEAAAAGGSINALVQLVDLARAGATTPEGRALLLTRLQALAQSPAPPAWALTEQGDLLLQDQGRWAGAEAARRLYLAALKIAPGDPATLDRLATLDMPRAAEPGVFSQITAQLRQAVDATGEINTMATLREAYLCRSPAAPEIGPADYWARAIAFSGDVTIPTDTENLTRILAEPTEEELALLQSQAIDARASAAGLYLAILQNLAATGPNGSEPAEARRLKALMDLEGVPYRSEMAKLARILGRTEDARIHLGMAVAQGEPGAELAMVELLAEDGPADPEELTFLLGLARKLAEQGHGAAIRALVAYQTEPVLTLAEAQAHYSAAIARNGDFDALILSLPFLKDPVMVREYRDRARALMRCDLRATLSMAEAAAGALDGPATDHWLAVADKVRGTEGWQMVTLGDALRRLVPGPEGLARAQELYREAAAQKYSPALDRLLAEVESGRLAMGNEEMAELFLDVLADQGGERATRVFARIDRAPAPVRAILDRRINREVWYRKAAEAGDSRAQLELARLIRARAEVREDLGDYITWLTRAAEAGQPGAMLDLSEAYSVGLGVDPSPELSRDWLIRAARAGSVEAIETARLLGVSAGLDPESDPTTEGAGP